MAQTPVPVLAPQFITTGDGDAKARLNLKK
jgi:hypothetical protein